MCRRSIFTFAKRLSQQAWILLWRVSTNALSAHRFFFRLFPQRDSTAVEPQDASNVLPRRPPPCITYRPIPGSWERKRHPHWPDHVFNIPQQPDEGDVYYVTKGDLIRMGRTALVELLPSGHIAKTPKRDPYSPDKEKENRRDMEREALIYNMVGASSLIPELIAWDPESCTLILQNYANGDLESYIRKPDYNNRVSISIRLRWVLQAAEALAFIHAAGVTHNDVAPRNFLLDEDLDLGICDFAGSSRPDETCSTSSPGSRYESRPWSRDYVFTQADDIFALGSVLYFVLAGEEPYSDLDDEEVEHRFENQDFPVSDHLSCGTVIQDCWYGRFTAAEQVVEALLREARLVSAS